MKVFAMIGAGLALLGLATTVQADPASLRIGYQ
ncbi:aliphatic sulfonate ABC transporter substrate-binding protein, partial [Pseudomonas sp. MAFF212428]|nr:aliphatic sulfonate ABC transporter substrate-binding protein [Pseudomonas brassicae]